MMALYSRVTRACALTEASLKVLDIHRKQHKQNISLKTSLVLKSWQSNSTAWFVGIIKTAGMHPWPIRILGCGWQLHTTQYYLHWLQPNARATTERSRAKTEVNSSELLVITDCSWSNQIHLNFGDRNCVTVNELLCCMLRLAPE